MKQTLVSLLFICTTICFSGCPAQAQSQAQDTTAVYITRKGEKYHKGICHHLRNTKIKTTLKEALENGYDACSVCKPVSSGTARPDTEVQPRSTSVQCSGMTQAGARCRRMTKSGNGRCYQHGG